MISGTHNVPKGSWSDDTSMFIATMESIINNNGNINYKDIMNNFIKIVDSGEFTSLGYAFDVGLTITKSLDKYRKTNDELNSGCNDLMENGNGSLMRILSISLYCIMNNSSNKEMIEIIDYASTVYMHLYDRVVDEEISSYITRITYSAPSAIQCKKEYGGQVTIITPYEDCYIFKNNEKQVDNAYRQLRKIMELNPMILCRTNKQVKTIQEFGITNVSTIHQAKGLEYDHVIVIDTEINCLEDLNVAYVALTRAKDSMLIINFAQFENFLKCR
jgi:hypothetical protein